MYHDVAFGYSVFADGDNFQRQTPRVESEPLLIFRSEQHRLAVLQPDLCLSSGLLLAELVKCTVVEHVAVLINLRERGARVAGGALEHVSQMLGFHINGARHKAGVTA